jgi:predicted N-acetyltransferase YhbS
MEVPRLSGLRVRALRADDDLQALTELIHAAYAPHAARGLRFWGTHQSVDDTAKRLRAGEGYVAEIDGRSIGTVTLRRPQPDSPVVAYRDPFAWSLGQFAVAPAHKGRGVGRALHTFALERALSLGAHTILVDTAAPAVELIEMYRRWGYEPCGECDWRPLTNYLSVLMRRSLTREPKETA